MKNKNTKTYELKIFITTQKDKNLIIQTKEELKAFLSSMEIDSFVEGELSSIEEDTISDLTLETLDTLSPISIFSYEQNKILNVQKLVKQQFQDKVQCQICFHNTIDWLENWKESFKPIITQKFCIYPPWEQSVKNKIPLCIEPAMAFGTGQHATTILCINTIEELYDNMPHPKAMLDVGCGTGILAIAAKKLGFETVTATDIDSDAVIACKQNAKLNNVEIEILHTSLVQKEFKYDLICANILASTLKSMASELSRLLNTDGLIVISGILKEQEQEMINTYTTYNLNYIQTKEADGWVAIVFKG